MKRFSLILIMLTSGLMAFSQSLSDANKFAAAKDYKNAKNAIDAYLAVPKNAAKQDGSWYSKGRIYNALSFENTVTADEKFNLKTQAFEAFKKEQQIDPKDFHLKLEGYSSFLDLYLGFFDLGANQFNAKEYEKAYNSFVKALEVKDFILAKDYSFSQATLYPLDTALVMNAAVAATQAKKETEAVTYYRKLADANVKGPGYEDIYKYLADYYIRKEDQANLQPILTKAKNLYPKEPFWNLVEIDALQKKGDKSAMYAKYDEILAKNPNSFDVAYDYSVDLYRNIYMGDEKPANDEELKKKLTSVLKMAIAADTGNDARMLMSNHLFNSASDLSIAASVVKGTKPEDIQKKKDLTAKSIVLMDEFIPYGEATIAYFESRPAMTKGQKVNYRTVLGYMGDIYNAKKDLKKAADYEKKRSAVTLD